MDISKCSMLLLDEQALHHNLPHEIVHILRSGSNIQYLDTLSRLAIDDRFTTKIFTTHEPVFVELCSRWLPAPETDDLSALAALARILPSAPHLSIYAKALLSRKGRALGGLASQGVTFLNDLAVETLSKLLLAICRLMRFDNEAFASFVSPAQLQLLLRHANRSIRYLAIRIFCHYIHASDAALVSMIKVYIGEGEIAGQWEDQTIDYTFHSLWEEKRVAELDKQLEEHERRQGIEPPNGQNLGQQRILDSRDFSATVACIGGVLIPRLDGRDVGLSALVMTETMSKNMALLALGVRSPKPLLVTGLPGAGKTLAIRDIARELGKSSSMLTLHLNEQTDAKLLIGMYTSAKAPGSFSWRPGVLTTAVMEGRWVIIEDLDRAPKEIISTLLPLLERRELLVPNWTESIRAAPNFKLIATMQSTVNNRGDEIVPTAGMIGLRHWLQVPFKASSSEELMDIAIHRYPLLRAHVPKFMDVYRALSNPELAVSYNSTLRISTSRSVGAQDFLRWCGRVQNLLLEAGVTSNNEPISASLNDYIFLEAVDCLLGMYPSCAQKSNGIELIAQHLQMPVERAVYCLEARKPEFQVTSSLLRLGRTTWPQSMKTSDLRSRNSFGKSPFATPDHVVRILESVAVAVRLAEPCLLVGETGTGKTTIVQRLADALGHKLTVVNLSQQSEAGDLLGGYKPINIRTLAIPLKDEFDELLGLTSTSTKNQPYIEALARFVSKGRWTKALTLWQDTLRMIEKRLKLTGIEPGEAAQPSGKKRKVVSPKLRKLTNRWNKFAADVRVFQMHLASGSKGFAFSFVEGNIVKAARNGEWVLLDEINLASTDTLESLADLFSTTIDGGPSLLLTESGDTERIYAHDEFRIFAAMNPATDIGKRDLPVGLRSRFTELFIEAPDKDLENLVSVVKAYLGTYSHTDVRAAHDIARLYLDIKELAYGNRLVDGANQKPHFSLRTLTRTLIYVLDITPTYGLRRAIYEGFAMSFLTVLSTESELLLRPLIEKYIFGDLKNGRSSLHQPPRQPQDGRSYVQFKHYWIVQGSSVIANQDHYIITPFIERNLLNLVRAASTRRFPVLLQGPTSSGKTSMIEYLARISGNTFVRINNHEHTDIQEYLGTYISGPDGRLRYQEGVLVHALRQGHWVVLDELNLAPTDVLEALNRLLDDNRELFIPETQQIVRPHENFMLFATQNPPGMYGGRKALSRAFRNRFLELHFDDIPEDELETILRERSQIAPSFCTKIVAVYKKLSTLRQSDRLFERKESFATLRDLFRWALREADDRQQLAVNGFLLLAERVRNHDEHLAVKNVIEDVMKVKLDEDKIYDNVRIHDAFQVSSFSGIAWTRSMRRTYLLVSEALKHNEPVLLVGDTGSGKTTICQYVAELAKTRLHMMNAHQNMETSDLIGAQRPVRNRRSAEIQLTEELIRSLKDCGAFEESHTYDLPGLLQAYENLQHQRPDDIAEDMRSRIEQSKTRVASLFEWADGSLVNAMRRGEYFLLDEISLADDSVLERLNSVLEPGRTLYLAEKGSADSHIDAASGFQFLATMNPGGDYGKRELSPALRNRFTEIWVPNASSEEEVLEIVQHQLTTRLANFCKPMVAFAAWYSATYSTATPCISIRDILSWIQFTNKFQDNDPWLGLLHGATMVYVDNLGANPASKASIPDNALPKARKACISKLDEVFGQNLSAIHDKTHILWDDEHRFGIGPFSLAKAPGSRQDSRYSLQAPTTRINTMKMLRALQLSKPILIEGSPGVGKTTLVSALATAIGMPLTRINLSDQTDLIDLFGSDVPIDGEEAGHFRWRDAPFLRAMQKGEWVLLDEMNLASQSVLEGLNACLDHRGQVYVSELDQTFERHSSFVVFAAQNPHHQGSGRKGLPASFVNRFTVVYADIFTPEDLDIISSEIFPSVPRDDRERVLHCVTALSQGLQQDSKLGAYGGPWEINLRDVLRWFHLLTARTGLMPFASSADFQSLLLLQRFRTAEDVVAASEIIRPHLPQITQRSRFHAKSTGLLEVGIGLLPRDSRLQSISSGRIKGSRSSLTIVESIMLSIQNAWPCLLVGASGSGKSEMVLQLAALVGADVVEISLNPEMDTVDLIGTYEQADPQRKIAGFMKRLQRFTRRTIIWEVMTEEELSDDLTALDAKLLQASSDLPDILECARSVAEEYRGSEFARFLEEGEDIVEQSSVDNRARFEWVDGIIVKALKEGKWVILDNANLCSSSVLDRLNSLLEPNGFLSIHEHRNPDGSAQIVHPHKDFRLFMTMDPRHGELSRAMRNRSIELFVPDLIQFPSLDLLGSRCEATISRFDLFQAYNWDGFADARFRGVLSIFFDHLTFSEFKYCRRWETQVVKGLKNMSPLKLSMFSTILKTYRWLFDHDGPTIRGIADAYHTLGEEVVSLSPDFGSMQALMTIDQNLAPDKTTWTKLERSMMSLRTNSFRDESTRPLASFLQDMGLYLRSTLEGANHDVVEDLEEVLTVARDILSYLQEVLDLTHAQDFSESEFHVYQSIGRSLSTYKHNHGGQISMAADLARELGTKLDTFNASWQLSSGRYMEKLWSAFRPTTAKNTGQLEFSFRVKKLADQFDELPWSSGASIRELGKLQIYIVQIHETIETQSLQNTNLFNDAQVALEDLENRIPAYRKGMIPYFRHQFEALYQHRSWSNLSTSTYARELGLLAGRPTRQLMNSGPGTESWYALAQIGQQTGGYHPHVELAPIRGILPLSLLRKLGDTDEVPLQSMKLLCTEIDIMAESIMTSAETLQRKPLINLYLAMKRIKTEVRRVLNVQRDYRDARSHIDQLVQQYVGNAQNASALNERSEYLLSCLESATNEDNIEAIISSSEQYEGFAKCASLCIRFFTGCLLLYVPNRPFDPATRFNVEQTRYVKRKADMENKLHALRDFEAVFSGTTSSFRIDLAERNLLALGSEPQVPSIVRPEVSELAQLQHDFHNIMSTVVMRSVDHTTPEIRLQKGTAGIQETRLLRANIAQAITRLSKQFDSYQDITGPLISWLQGLDIGLGLAALTNNTKSPYDDAIELLCKTTPFFGAGPVDISNMTLENHRMTSNSLSDPRLHTLRYLSVAHKVNQTLEDIPLDKMFRAYHSLYEEWKEILGKEQLQNAAEASLYRYRGNEEDNDEAEEQDFRRLFPGFEDLNEGGYRQAGGAKNPREQALCVAQIQRDTFQSIGNPSEALLNLLRTTSESIANLWNDDSGSSISPVPPEATLSALVLRLDKQKECLHGEGALGRHCHFYTDANLIEAQKLVTLVYQIVSRFTEIQVAWPEYATLSEILKISCELLKMRHTEPIAKLLTKTEQLHSFVHQWQVVASRQYTAVSLYDQLTDLLISWRRLELSTWARLLDMEDQKCGDDADAWWFLAYELIVAAPLSMINAGDDVRKHAEKLFVTLSDFIEATSMGQYDRRLGMIDCFKGYLEVLEIKFPLISLVRNAITNLISYYTRFKFPIRDALSKGRQQLERDMKEILLLASWKDTNINALRESAKRSHHKLFKVIRKYRTLLAQPIKTILGQGFPYQNTLSGQSNLAATIPNTSITDPRAQQICQECIRNWQIKPERFRYPDSTAQQMLLLSQLPSTALDVASHLRFLSSSLVESMTALRKETPSEATKETVSAIRYLKARKRKLYADTLRDIRQMGFRPNMSTKALARQASTAMVLTNSPAFAGVLFKDDLGAAEYQFHKILYAMSLAKARSRNHSDDLTHEEVNKSLGYLEHMLSIVLKQRGVLASAVLDLEAFDKTVKKMRNLWTPASYVVRKQDPGKGGFESGIHYVLSWLPGILETGSVIVKKYGDLADIDISSILMGLRNWINKIHDSLRTFANLPELPIGVTSSKHEEAIIKATGMLGDFNTYLQLQIQQHPGLTFVFKQLALWTNPKPVSGEQHVNGQQPKDLDTFVDGILAVLDSILFAIQRMKEASSSMPTPRKDPSWLSQGGLKSLHVGKIDCMLKDTMSNIQYLVDGDDGGLEAIGALCALVMPIVQQYRNTYAEALTRYLKIHQSFCEYASIVSNAFCEIALNGFCSPTENSGAEAGNAEKLEGGTGLGEGEGNADISKDIADDEDISEIAQDKKKDKESENIEDQDDAVNMDHDELEGDIGEGSDEGDGDKSVSDGEENDIDEETGSVDDLDPSAVDEKLWNGKAEETAKQKEGSKAHGGAEEDDQIAADAAQQEEDKLQAKTEETDELAEECAEEDEDQGKEESGTMLDQAQEGQNLELPEEMDMDNVEGPDSESLSEDDDLDAMSDVQQEQADIEKSGESHNEAQAEITQDAAKSPLAQSEDFGREELETDDVEGSAASPVDTNPSVDEEEGNDQGLAYKPSDDAVVDPTSAAPNDAIGFGEDINQEQDVESAPLTEANAKKGIKGSASVQDDSNVEAEDGQSGASKNQSGDGQTHDDGNTSEAFKKLGDALEKWHRQIKQIMDPTEQDKTTLPQTEEDSMADRDFEHLQHEEAEGDTQALGAATHEQARALDEAALDSEMHDEPHTFPLEEVVEEGGSDDDEVMGDSDKLIEDTDSRQEYARSSKIITQNAENTRRLDAQKARDNNNEEYVDELDDHLSATIPEPAIELSSRSAEEARRLWSYYEVVTRDLSLTLTEQLRLILAPTLATKMRGDFRTGKRLNIKRVIPYIASQYKRDKIWMRRSIPSRRNYQIILAVDDSKSMGESGSGQLAFETLALIAKSLSMLEAGEICVVGFGNELHVAHEFDKPFSSEAGARIFQHFGFQQTATDVRKLIAGSITLFREARRKRSSAGTDLWQLELIISDGVCEDHDTTRRLVRQAQEEHIMMVFVIVDAPSKGESIMDMSQAVFEPDAAGETKLNIRRYLDGFPFPYYLVVGNVRDLPGALAQVLRQWFAEVVDSG